MRVVSPYGNSQERLHRTDGTTVQRWKIQLGHEEGITREKNMSKGMKMKASGLAGVLEIMGGKLR